MKKIFLYILLATILFANEQNYIEIGGGSEKLKNNFSPESRKTIIPDFRKSTTNTHNKL